MQLSCRPRFGGVYLILPFAPPSEAVRNHGCATLELRASTKNQFRLSHTRQEHNRSFLLAGTLRTDRSAMQTAVRGWLWPLRYSQERRRSHARRQSYFAFRSVSTRPRATSLARGRSLGSKEIAATR